MRRRRRHALLGVGLLAATGTACERIEEPPRPPQVTTPIARAVTSPSEPTRSGAGTPSAASTASAFVTRRTEPPRRCVVPDLAEAPPAQRPAPQCPRDPGADAAPALSRGEVRFVEAPGLPKVRVERALSPDEQQRGLMYRTRLGSDEGMIFSWGDEAERSFWMRNTCLPLDMLFITRDGTIAGILEQVPTLNELPRTIPCPVAHVLELNAGYARRKGIRAGQRVEIRP
jgi:uncharacterized protein